MGHWLRSSLSFGIVPLIVERILVLCLVMLLREHYKQWSNYRLEADAKEAAQPWR
jgi:hypothetical protein